jgi:hypothetical protein
LKGKKVGQLGGFELISMMAAYVGLDPKKDLTLVSDPAAKPLDLFVEGRLDAYLALPGRSQNHPTLAVSVACPSVRLGASSPIRHVVGHRLQSAESSPSSQSPGGSFG